IDHLKEFRELRNIIQDELLRHDGTGDLGSSMACAACASNTGELRCIDCVGLQLECAACICARHALEPCHRLKRWNGVCYTLFSLYEAGLSIQLGHDDLKCPNPHPSTNDITVIDILGIHKTRVRFCDCAQVGSARTYIQLLRANWWPVTLYRPQTVVTIRTLKFFHALTLKGKINAYDFYNGLVGFTDGSGLRQPKSRYHEFTRATRCYRHTQMTKRGGRGHDEAGIEGTQTGSLVVECPACPHPGRNLPQGWEDAPAPLKFLYSMFLAIDTNFKLKLKNHNYTDLELAPGWAYFVPEPPYQEHLASHEDEEEMKNCDSTFAAVDHANMPGQKRFCVNGVGAVVCARHSFFRPNSVGDLPRGERYVSMGFILLMTISMAGMLWRMLTISYDIACQFSKNFSKRMKTFPPNFRINSATMDVKFLVPKFHLPAHGPKCQVKYSFNLTEGVGRTHGEGIEANWSQTNGVALATREMPPGARHEALNDYFGAMNWWKTISMGKQLARSMADAVYMREEQSLHFQDLKSTFPEDVVERWDNMIEAWDSDQSQPNPYEEPEKETTLADVRLEIVEEEARQVTQGNVSLHEMTAGTFLSIGMDLQEQQRTLQQKDETHSMTTKKKLTLPEKRSALNHRIQAWRQVQMIYMPAVSSLQTHSAESDDTSEASATPKPEFEKLWMPSDLPLALRNAGILPGLVEKEWRLREAEAEDALHEIRRLIRVHLGLRNYKKKQVNGPGQKCNTRTRDMITRFCGMRDRQFHRYNAARKALDALEPDEDASWRTRLLPLSQGDLVDPSGDNGEDDDHPNQTKKAVLERRRQRALGEGRREIPWIWRTIQPDSRDVPHGEELTVEEIHDSMCVTYAKGRARARRWNEEVQLLTEEMRRVLVFLQWKQAWWYSRVDARPDAPADIKSGLRGYATRQCLIYNNLATSFKNQWTSLLKNLNLQVILPEITPVIIPSEPEVQVESVGNNVADYFSDNSEESDGSDGSEGEQYVDTDIEWVDDM
ncbi:hypothetical protein DENSPDRAFT_788380, partial [Dentipellis sp. KUC8613]